MVLAINQFDCWKKEEQHGLIHGYMTTFIASVYYPRINEKTILSCFLHDYIKCIFNIEPHDQLLRNFFPNLDEDTYSHATKPNPNHPLIVADRVELMRFDNYELWLNKDMINSYFNFDDLKLFYQERSEIVKIVKNKLDFNVI